MELALIPVAALLLLLTSMGTPAHTTALGSTAADVLRIFFPTPEDAENNVTPDEPCPKPAHRGGYASAGQHVVDQQEASPCKQLQRPQTLDKRASRFSSASVAYRTTAPPAAC